MLHAAIVGIGFLCVLRDLFAPFAVRSFGPHNMQRKAVKVAVNAERIENCTTARNATFGRPPSPLTMRALPVG